MKAKDRARKTIKRMKGESPYDGSWWSWAELEKLFTQEIQDVRRDTIEECAKVIRTECSVCGGTGIGRYEPATYVSHDMALDAEQPEREGSLYSPEINEECEYCGRPIDAIRTLLEEDKTLEEAKNGR